MEYSQLTRQRMSEAKKRFFANGGIPWNKMSSKESIKKCLKCKKDFRITNRGRIKTAKFCSIECAKGHNIFDRGNVPWNKGKTHLKGEKHWNWKGGIDKEHTRIKQTNEYKNWPELRFDLNNGMVLCRKCHQITHKPRRKNYYD